jgi:hypothetical protein
MATVPATNMSAASAFTRAAEILGRAGSTLQTAAQSTFPSATAAVSSSVVSTFTPENGRSVLSTVYYALLFLLLIFIILTIVNYTITPIFSFAPGQPGILSVPGSMSDDELFWDSSLPHENDYRPRLLDKLSMYNFKNNFSASVDCYLPILSGIPIHKRILFFKTSVGISNTDSSGAFWSGYTLSSTQKTLNSVRGFLNPSTGPSKVSMVAYVDEENKLTVDFFDSQKSPISLGPIENVPTSTPFRVSIVAHETLLELYINGRLAVSRTLTSPLSSPISGKEVFYPPPQSWRISTSTAIPGSCSVSAAASGIGMKIFNLHLWPRPLSAPEVLHMSPSLPTASYLDTVNSTAGTPPTSTQSLPSGSGTLQQSSCPPQQGSYNPFKDIDTKSFILLIASLAGAIYLFKNNRPSV